MDESDLRTERGGRRCRRQLDGGAAGPAILIRVVGEEQIVELDRSDEHLRRGDLDGPQMKAGQVVGADRDITGDRAEFLGKGEVQRNLDGAADQLDIGRALEGKSLEQAADRADIDARQGEDVPSRAASSPARRRTGACPRPTPTLAPPRSPPGL